MIYCPNGGRGDGGGRGENREWGRGERGGMGKESRGERWGSAIMRQTIWFSEPPQGEDARASALT